MECSCKGHNSHFVYLGHWSPRKYHL